MGKMEEPRFSMGTVVYDGLIYLVGGCTHTRRHMQELVSYNPVSTLNLFGDMKTSFFLCVVKVHAYNEFQF